MNNKEFEKVIFGYLSKQKGKIGFGVLFAFLATLFSISSAYTLKILVDDILIANEPKGLWPIQGIFILLVLLNCGFTLARDKFFLHVGASILSDIRSALFRKISFSNVLTLSEFQKGDLISIVNYDVDGLEGVFSKGIPTLISSLIQIALTLIIMFLLNVRLTLITLPIIPIIVIIFHVLHNKVRKLADDIQNDRSKVTSGVEEMLTNILTVKSLDLASFLTAKFSKRVNSLQSRIANLYLIYTLLSLASWVMVMVPYQAIMYGVAGSWYFQYGSPSIGLMLAFANYANTLIAPILAVVSFNRDYKYGTQCWHRIDRVLQLTQEEHDPIQGKKLSSLKKEYFDRESFLFLCRRSTYF